VNRVGTAKSLVYVGDSAVISPLGEVLAECGDGEEIVTTEVDAATVAHTRRTLPFLPDRRKNVLGG